ncbi:unnamed protein product [Sphagnum tenellum]
MVLGRQVVAGPLGCSQVRFVWRPSYSTAFARKCFRSFLGTRIYHSLQPVWRIQPLSRISKLPVAVPGRGKQQNRLCELFHGLSFGHSMGVAAMAEASAITKYYEKRLNEEGIELPSYHPGAFRMTCPKCLGGSSKEKSLCVTIPEDGTHAVWICHRGKCGWKGSTHSGVRVRGAVATNYSIGTRTNGGVKSAVKPVKRTRGKSNIVHTVESLGLEPLGPRILSYLEGRGLSKETIAQNYVMQCQNYNNGLSIAFPYLQDGRILNCKFRDADKKFWQVKDATKILYGLDNIKNCTEIVIVEGEIDKLAMHEAGIFNCVSVPDGAPPNVSSDELPAPEDDKKYEYLWNCKEYFEKATRIILATDSDEPGQALAEELARRLGRERCWRVNWPEKAEGELFKDANEVLRGLGHEGVKDLIEHAELYPIRGLFSFREFFKEIDDYYHLRLGDEKGVSTGWRSLDEIYRVVPGELTIVTGVPNSGKSEWIDALICNLNKNRHWTFALCSMENKVREHARKLIEKHIGQPFFDASYANSIPRMSKEDLERGKKWLQQNFFLIRHEDEQLPSVEWVLNLAKAAVLRHGIRGLVIDPYNELDHQRPGNQTETEYVSQMLTKIKRFAQHHDCHVWFVAHPKQLQVWKGEAPGLYDVSGSAHFINKCDNGIVIHRNRDASHGPLDQVEVLVRKVRNKVAGTIGDASLRYNRTTGLYEDIGGPR